MAHLPGYYIGLNENVQTYALSPQDAVLAARRGVDVIPTANLTDSMPDLEAKAKTRTNQIRNLKMLKEAGVKFGIGTDSVRHGLAQRSSLPEQNGGLDQSGNAANVVRGHAAPYFSEAQNRFFARGLRG